MPTTLPNIERRWKNLPGEPVGDAGDAYTGYDRFGRTERMRWIKPSGEGFDSLVDVQWGYNRASLKTWRKDLLAPASTGQDQHFGYDGLYQVKERQRGLLNINTTAVGGIPAQIENFSYDETGNWVSYRQSNNGDLDIEESRVNNRSNQMTQVDGASAGVKYDKNGNMLLVPTGDGLTGPSRKLEWDAWNRLRKVSDENDDVIALYEYDGSARRTVKQAEGTTRRYYYNDQWRSVEERINGESPAELQHVWHPVNRWEMLFRDRGGERHYPLKDQLDVVALCDSAGAVLERYDYTAFGTTSVLNEDFTPKEEPTITWNFLFHAEFVDHETGWYNYGYRYYVPTLGRWFSRDPIGIAGGLNLYGFVSNNSMNGWDILGLKAGKLDGAKAIRDSLLELEKECDCCVDTSTVSECKTQAGKVVEAMAKAWEDNWGKGPGSDTALGSDTVGGYFCWDWANGFDNAAKSASSTIWDNSFEKYASTAGAGAGTPVHYSVKIQIKSSKIRSSAGTCDGFVYDDGFMDGSIAHGSGCKPNPVFPRPATGYTPVTGSTNPNDFAHPDMF